MEIEKVEPEKFGLETTKAAAISSLFTPMLQAMEGLENQKNEIVNHYDLQIGSDVPPEKETSERAKALRLQYKRIRIQTEKAHKEAKAYYLAGGRFVDALKNTHAFAAQGVEKELKDIEDHYENVEKEKIEAIRLKRTNELNSFQAHIPSSLGEMHEDTYQSILTGVKASQKAEQERIEKEKKDAEELKIKEDLFQARKEELRPYFNFLDPDFYISIETTEDEYKILMSTAKNKKFAFDKQQEEIQKENERLRKEKEEAEEIQRKKDAEAKKEADRIKAENDKKLEIEKKKREALEKEKKDRELQEVKAEQEKAEAARQMELAPDKEKLTQVQRYLNQLEMPKMSSPEATRITSDIAIDIENIVDRIQEQKDNL